MTLDDAIRQCRDAMHADNTTRMSREALGMLIDHAAAGQSLRRVYPPEQPTGPALERLAAKLMHWNGSDSGTLGTLREFDWGNAAPVATLRDQFATAAMQAAATNPTGADGFNFEQRAAWAYQQADAMLAARGGK